MFTIAIPPRIQPTQAFAKAISFSEIPPEPIRHPMVMKKGTAIKLKELIPFTICWQIVVRGSPWDIRQNTEERATAYAIGKRSMIIRKKLPSNIKIAILSTLILLFLLYIKTSDMIIQCFNLENDHCNTC